FAADSDRPGERNTAMTQYATNPPMAGQSGSTASAASRQRTLMNTRLRPSRNSRSALPFRSAHQARKGRRSNIILGQLLEPVERLLHQLLHRFPDGPVDDGLSPQRSPHGRRSEDGQLP